MSEQELQSWPLPADDAPTLASGRYRLATKLGEGGMAAVYRGWDTHNRTWVAIKVLLPEFARRRKLRKRFANEAETMLKLDHRHIIRVFDVGTDAELPFIVMEIAGGGCVIDWVDAYGPMPARMAIDVVMQACKGLKAAHEMGVVHRDMKPHNILVNHRAVCKVTDFGIAQIDDAGGGMTKTGSVMGTLGYMAPEQRADSKNVDVRADVYGLGATLYKLVTGGTVADLFLAEHDAELLEGVPPSLVPVLLKATAYKPDNRHSTVAELARDLHKAKADTPPVPDNTPGLVMPIPEGERAEFTGSELSEPTFPGLPDLDATSDPDEGTLKPPEWTGQGETTDPERPKVLPYFMPTANTSRRITDLEDAVPDYIEDDGQPQVETGYEVELDEESKAQAAEARRLAIEQGLLDEDGNPIPQEPDEDINPIHKLEGGLDVLDNTTSMLQAVFDFFYYIFIKPMQTGGVAVAGLILVATFVFGQSAFYVRGYQVEAMGARNTFYLTLDAEKKVLEDLTALGADQTMLNGLWKVYADTSDEPARMTNALRLLSQLDTTIKAVEQNEEAVVMGHKLHMARQRVARVRRLHRDYTSSMIAWEEAADSGRGSLAVRVGLARRP